VHNFNFAGQFCDSSGVVQPKKKRYCGARAWLHPFTKAHFGKDDWYVNTDCCSDDESKHNYAAIGQFDHSLEVTASKREPLFDNATFDNDTVPFHQEYYTHIAQSNFTLCPAGDSPFSYRFLEAVLAHSIPIVSKAEFANAEWHHYGEPLKISQSIGWHFYVQNSDSSVQYTYNQTWVDENYAKALEFHTLI